jgi:hypothetical protein
VLPQLEAFDRTLALMVAHLDSSEAVRTNGVFTDGGGNDEGLSAVHSERLEESGRAFDDGLASVNKTENVHTALVLW